MRAEADSPRSISSGFNPACARYSAAKSPAHPAPTTTIGEVRERLHEAGNCGAGFASQYVTRA